MIGILIYNDNQCVSMHPKSFDWIFSYIIALLNRTCDYDTAICKSLLLCEGMRIVIPTSLDELWENILSTGISFSDHDMSLNI